MRIVQWNCQCSFRTKHENTLALKPDILVVCECENEERLDLDKHAVRPFDFYWEGDVPHKGIGIFSYSDWNFELHPSYRSDFKYVIPLIASNNNQSLNLIAVWTQGSNGQIRYIEHVWFALKEYEALLGNETIIIGDFNSNVQWDSNNYAGNHTDVVNRLQNLGIHSLYHRSRQLPQGNEPDPTFFMYRHKDKPYHIDYCFVHESLLSEDWKIKVGEYDDWCNLSDHIPLIIDL